VAASTGAEVHVWDATTGVLLARHELGELLPSAIALDPTGRILAVNPGAPAVNPDKERTVELLDAVTGKPVEKLTGPKGGQWVAFAPDGKTLLVGDAAGVRWWNPAAGKLIRAFEGFEDRLRYGGHEFPAARFSADGKMLVTASYRALHRWDAATGKPLFAETHGAGHFAEVTALGISADGKRIATAGPDERLRVWDAANGKPLLNVPAHMGFAVNLEFSPDGKSVYAGSGRFALAQWDIATGKELRRFTLGPKLEQILTNGPGLAGFHVSADGKQLLAVHNGRGFDPLPWMTNWNTEIGERTGSVELEQHWPLAMRRYRVQFSPDGKFATTGGNAFPTAQGPQGNTLGERVLGPGYEAGAFSGDGTLIAYWTNEERGNRFNIKVAVVYNPITGRKVAQLPDDSGGRLALSPDGKILVSANGDDLCFWDVFAGERIARYKGPAADRAYHVVSFAEVIWFSPDGTYVVTGNSDSTALVWRVPERPKK
jgi:WD40 repeat protein